MCVGGGTREISLKRCWLRQAWNRMEASRPPGHGRMDAGLSESGAPRPDLPVGAE